MKPARLDYSPVNGKTYTLFGESDSTSEYYKTIRLIADKILQENGDIGNLVMMLARYSTKKKILRSDLRNHESDNIMSVILNFADPLLESYTEQTKEHLKTLPFKKICDRRLSTTREQYHLYMVEIELTNRLYIEEFKRADRKIALLPYCLQDFSVNCKAEKIGFDYQCRHCSGKCFQNHASGILESYGIEPYIWMGGDMKQLAKYTLKDKKSFSVLGIACIPELTFGMRSCRKNNIPVVGIPLNANRCKRWFGNFFPNSIDLTVLELLLAAG
jgi:hypothetical protein